MSKIKYRISKDGQEARNRNYATVVYEESSPKDWMKVLKAQRIPAFVSPLHNEDINPGGELKKSHWHVVVMFDGPKTVKQVKTLFDKIGGIGLEIVQSLRGYVRYLCHLDNPEKAQYDPLEVISFCGADYFNTIHLVTDRHKVLREIRMFCKKYEYYSYSDLVDYCDENRPDWVTVLDDNTIGITEYLKSRFWTKQNLKC